MENSAISWTDHTFNPWMGCTRVSDACKFCYAERDMDHRYGKVQWGPSGTRVLTSEANWRKPLKWNEGAAAEGRRMRVFCASLADVFEDWTGPISTSGGGRVFVNPDREFMVTEATADRVPSGSRFATMQDVREQLFCLIDATPHLIWLLLTKRPENIWRMWSLTESAASCDPGAGMRDCHRPNVFLGTSVENQQYADERIPHLLKCRDLCGGTFLSCEPLLGPVDLGQSLGAPSDWCDRCDREVHPARLKYDDTHDFCGEPVREIGGIDWIIAGTESGGHRRVADTQWIESLRDQCEAAGVPFFLKQIESEAKVIHDIEQFPEGLRIQQAPFDQSVSGGSGLGVGEVSRR